MIDFPVVLFVTHAVMALLGMLLNLFLIYLALFQTPKIIRSYATLIINFALTDFFACFSDLFVQQRIIPGGLTLGFVSNGFCKYFGPNFCYVGYSLMLHCLSHFLWSLLLSFSYRYYILHKPAPSRPTLIVVVLVIYLPSLFQWIVLLWSQDEPEEIVVILHDKFPSYNLTDQCITGIKNIISFSTLYVILHMTLPITPVYICILILRKKIIARLSFQGVHLTDNTKHMHAQLLMALTYQAIIPGFYLFGVVSYAIGQLDIYNSPVLEYFTFTCAIFIPILSPIASLVYVTPYRKFIERTVFRIVKVKPNDTLSAQHNNSMNSKIIG